jgi:hypothetical protein
MRWIRRGYFAYPVQDGLVDASVIFAEAARSAGTDVVVNLSQLLQRSGDQPTPHQTRHWLSEQVFDLGRRGGGAPGRGGVLREPSRPGRTQHRPCRGGRAAVGTAHHRDPDGLRRRRRPRRGRPAHRTSPTARHRLALIGDVVTNSQIADTLGEVLGRHIGYREISDDQWLTNIAAAGINPTAVEHLVHLWRYLRTRPADYQATYQVTDTIEAIGGAKPKSLRQFLSERDHATSSSWPSP